MSNINFEDDEIARNIIDKMMGEDGWYRGTPDEIVDIAVKLHDKGFLWTEVKEMLEAIIGAVRGEFE